MSRNVEIVIWDVQHGNAAYIKSPNGRHIVIDLGIGDYSGGNTAFSPLRHLRFNYNVQQLDYVIITHPHLDHIDDILNFDLLNPKVLHRPRHLTNEEVMQGVRNEDRAKFVKYCEINSRYNTNVQGGLDDPSIPDNFGGLKIMTFVPTTCSHDNFNNHSLITVMEFAEIKIVIPGDNEACSYEELMKNGSFKEAIKNAYILVAPHHGRESGYNNEFVSMVNPSLTIVSDGRFRDTSANARYSQKSTGWTVYKKSNGTKSDRKCLTTNSDGEVTIHFGYNSSNERFLYVAVS